MLLRAYPNIYYRTFFIATPEKRKFSLRQEAGHDTMKVLNVYTIEG